MMVAGRLGSGASGRQTTPRELAIAVAGGLALTAVLVPVARYLFRPAEAPVSAAAEPPVPAPAPLPPTAAQPPSLSIQASASGLMLYGVLGGSGEAATAIIGRDETSQRLIRIGREVAPGVTLNGVEQSAVILMVGTRPMRLALRDAGGAKPMAAAPTAAASDRKMYQLGLGAHREAGQITGYMIRPGVPMPLFEKAGLKPGDIITGLNGRAFTSQAEVDGLAREVAVSATIVLNYRRGDQSGEARVEL